MGLSASLFNLLSTVGNWLLSNSDLVYSTFTSTNGTVARMKVVSVVKFILRSQHIQPEGSLLLQPNSTHVHTEDGALGCACVESLKLTIVQNHRSWWALPGRLSGSEQHGLIVDIYVRHVYQCVDHDQGGRRCGLRAPSVDRLHCDLKEKRNYTTEESTRRKSTTNHRDLID